MTVTSNGAHDTGAYGPPEAAYGDADLFTRLGLTSSQRLVYEQLCKLGTAEPKTLVQETGLNAAVVIRALGGLQSHGLAVPSCGTTLAWTATAPDTMAESLLIDQEERLRDLRAQVDELMAAYHHSGVRRGRAADVVEVVWGRQAIEERWQRLQAGARKRLLVLDKPPHVQRHDAATELMMLARGVEARVIYEQESLLQPDALDQVREMALAGEQARVSVTVPYKLAVADERWAMLPVAPGTELESALLVRPSTLLDALVATFELQWSQAVPLTEATLFGRASPGEQATADDGPLVTLLAAGLTDDAIARQLGISARTVQRRVSELMRQLGARNRFQAGVQIAHRTAQRQRLRS